MTSYTDKVTWQYFHERCEGVPADAIVDQRIKMAARYAALGSGLSASAYTAAIIAILESLGGASLAAPRSAGSYALPRGDGLNLAVQGRRKPLPSVPHHTRRLNEPDTRPVEDPVTVIG